jgi:integrase
MKRTRIGEGIFSHQYGYAVTWMDRGRQREKHFPRDTPTATLRAYRKRQQKVATEALATAEDRGSFVRDLVRYLRSRRGRPSYKADRSHLRPWAKVFGRFSRHAITREKIARVLADWGHLSARELRHRVNVLRQVFHLLDGPGAPTPCDGIPLPTIPKTRPKGVPDALIETVGLALAEQERKGRLRDGKTRARFLVLATCGKRPCQVMRARPIDVDLRARLWDVEPAKNSHGGPLYLNDEMLAAWQAFDQANAWGPYDPVSFAKTLRRNGWPAGVRPYRMRHQTLQTMSSKGVDFGAVQQAAGHASPETTRRSYVPHEIAQSKAASAAIEGRFASDMFAATERRSGSRSGRPAPATPAATFGLLGLPDEPTRPTRDEECQKPQKANNSALRPRLVPRASGEAGSRKLA